MSLHTEHRPGCLDDVIGQGHAVKAFRSAMGKSRAYLLVGPSGCGKTTLARIGAIEFGCSERDIVEVDAATNNGVDDMRSITSSLMHRPLGGGKRAFILDECHQLSKAGWNSLLKSIEEPPKWACWFLCTTEPQGVPATIVTRCARIELRSVDTDTLLDLLTGIAKKEKLPVLRVPGVIELCAKEAFGSPRQAIVNLEVCSDAESKADALDRLSSAYENPAAENLAKALLQREPWVKIQRIISELKDLNPESVRHQVRGYMTAVALGAKTPEKSAKAIEVLDAFSGYFPKSDGLSPILVACARVMFE